MIAEIDAKARTIVSQITSLPKRDERCLVAIAGPPASGKSTLAEQVCRHLTEGGCASALVPMDGFHLDNADLKPMGLLSRKGAPETFDLPKFAQLLEALRARDTVQFPRFDRALDRTLPDAGTVTATERHVIVEGNYLLFDAPGWRDLADHWAYSVFLGEPLSVLRQRLVQRWLDHGLSQDQALERAERNDLPNARSVLSCRLESSLVLTN